MLEVNDRVRIVNAPSVMKDSPTAGYIGKEGTIYFIHQDFCSVKFDPEGPHKTVYKWGFFSKELDKVIQELPLDDV